MIKFNNRGGLFMKIFNLVILSILFLSLNYSYAQDCSVKSVRGSAFLNRKGVETPLNAGTAVINEDVIRVTTGSLTINCPDKSIVVLKDNTQAKLRLRPNTPEAVFNFISSSYPSRYWDISKGNVVARVYSPIETKINNFFSTQDAVITAKGTDLNIKIENGTTVSAIKGTVAGADAGRTLTFALPQGTQGIFKSAERGQFLVKSFQGEFSVTSRESIFSFETGDSAYVSVDRVTGRSFCRVPKNSQSGVVLTSGDMKLIINPGQELGLDLTEKNTLEMSAGMEIVGDVAGKVPFCGTRLLLQGGSMVMVSSNPSARTVTVISHSGKVKVEASDGRVVELEGNQSFQDSCGIPVAEVVPPVEQPASPIKP